MVRFEQLGDSEIEQLHLAVARDHDVRRLEIPVHDQRLVRVLRRVGHGQEHAKAILDRQPVLIAVGRHRRSVDVLHHQICAALRREPGIEEARNVGMGEPPEDVRFRLEPNARR